MGYIESTLSGDEKVEYKFSYHWIKWVIPVILFIPGFMLFVVPSILGLYLIISNKIMYSVSPFTIIIIKLFIAIVNC